MKIALLYLPVVHKGHQQFWQKVQPDVLYVLGNSFREDFPLLERDMRALDPKDSALICQVLGACADVRILEKDTIADLKSADALICGDDEVLRQLVERYLPTVPMVFEKVFLRWDKMAAITSHPVDPDIAVSQNELDQTLIAQARLVAHKSSDWWRQVGVVIVKDGEVLLEGYNHHMPTEHAPYINGDPRANFNAGERSDIYTAVHGEAGLIARAARKGISLRGTSLYATTFPCPNCALLIIESGIQTIYYADGYSNLDAQENLKQAGIRIVRVLEA